LCIVTRDFQKPQAHHGFNLTIDQDPWLW
jgi:hypothetical protein